MGIPYAVIFPVHNDDLDVSFAEGGPAPDTSPSDVDVALKGLGKVAPGVHVVFHHDEPQVALWRAVETRHVTT